MANFWDFSVWSFVFIMAVLLVSLLLANSLKKTIPFLQKSLIPTPVLGGIILLAITTIYYAITGNVLFDSECFSGKGMETLETITFHCLALGFVASALKTSDKKHTKKRTREIFDSGITTVATYVLQGIVGLGITMLVAATLLPDLFPAAGILLPFGYGQGTGQAMNYGMIYENLPEGSNFIGGKNFGLTVAALGFLSASIGGVIHLHIMKKKGKLKGVSATVGERITEAEIQSSAEIPMNGSMDKITIQIGLIFLAYILAYGIMYLLSLALPSMQSVIYGFNFLIGVLTASLIKIILNLLKKAKIAKKQYTNNFLLNRISNFFFDIMIVAGIAAIRLDLLKDYWHVLLIIGVAGLVITYFYNRFVAKTLFKEYEDEQFLVMYGMLTGTASTGVVLLREIDPELKTPAVDNLIYQTIPAIAFGFPMMILATKAPHIPLETLIILIGFFIVMNIILFRSFIFKKGEKKRKNEKNY